VLRFSKISIDRYIAEWLYNNFAAGRFHTKKLVYHDFIRLKLNFIQKSVYEPPFRGFTGNVRSTSIAGWKARSRLPIRYG